MHEPKTNYTKLIKLMIQNNRTLLGLFQIAVIVGIAFLFSITSLSDTIIQTKFENTYKTYGRFLLVIPNVDSVLSKDIQKKNPSYQYKDFGIGGNIEYSGKKITYGSMDKNMNKIFEFHILDGKWPTNSNQIIIEDYVAYMFGIQGKKLPVSIPLKIHGQTASYEVTGIISNYSYRLVTPCDSNLETKAYPSVIFNPGYLKQEQKSLVILQKKLNSKTCSSDINSILHKDYKEELNVSNICNNFVLQFYTYKDMEDMITMKHIYRILLNLILIFVFVIMIKTVLIFNQKALSLFEAIGLTRKKKQIIILALSSLVLLIGLFMGAIFSFLFGILYINKAFSEYNGFYYNLLGKSILLECIIIAVLLIVFSFAYKNHWNESIIHGLNATNRKTEHQKYRFKKIDFYIVTTQAICLFFIIASLNFTESFSFQEKELVYDLYSKEIDSSLPINGFDYKKNAEEFFPYQDIDILNNCRNHISLQMDAETKNSSILIEKNHTDEYWKAYCTNDDSDFTAEKRMIWNEVSDEASKYNTIETGYTHILVLPQKEFLHFLQQHKIHNSKLEKNEEQSCVLLLPEYNKKISDASITKGGTILLGRIDNQKNNPVFLKESFKVADILSYSDNSSQIKIIISETVAKKSNLISGYHQISIKLAPNSSQATQRKVEEKIALLMASVQGGMLDSSVSRNQYHTLMNRYTSLLSNSLVFFCIISICLYIIMNQYIEWEKNKFEYGVLRSFGMSYSALQHKLFMKYFNSILVASVPSIFIANMAFPYGELTIQEIVIAFVITFTVTGLCRIIAYFQHRTKPVCSMLNRS